ncbi:MAG: hypothetical protein IJA61_02890 [Clostridia bacterium]|nr:hypothetical protein [Clostridia bacterium]
MVKDFKYLEDLASAEVDSYHTVSNENAILSRMLDNVVRTNVGFRLRLAQQVMHGLDKKLDDLNASISNIYKNYSDVERAKGKFSRRDAKLLEEYQSEKGKITKRIMSQEAGIEELKSVSRSSSGLIAEIRDLAKSSIMFGPPKDPGSKQNEQEDNMDFTKVSDRVGNYQRQIAVTENLGIVAESMGTKVAKNICGTLNSQMLDAKKQVETGIYERKAQIAELLDRYKLGDLMISDHRSSDPKDKITVRRALDALVGNSMQILKTANPNMLADYSKELTNNPVEIKEDASGTRLRDAIGALQDYIGGIEGMDVPKDKGVLTLLSDISDKYKFTFATNENNTPSAQNEKTTNAAMSAVSNQQTESVNDVERKEVVDPMAYGYYEAFLRSGSPKDFPGWCEEKGVDVPKGWKVVEDARVKGMEEYLAQQSASNSPNNQNEDVLEM